MTANTALEATATTRSREMKHTHEVTTFMLDFPHPNERNTKIMSKKHNSRLCECVDRHESRNSVTERKAHVLRFCAVHVSYPTTFRHRHQEGPTRYKRPEHVSLSVLQMGNKSVLSKSDGPFEDAMVVDILTTVRCADVLAKVNWLILLHLFRRTTLQPHCEIVAIQTWISLDPPSTRCKRHLLDHARNRQSDTPWHRLDRREASFFLQTQMAKAENVEWTVKPLPDRTRRHAQRWESSATCGSVVAHES